MPGALTDSVYRIAVKSGLYVDVPDCQRALNSVIREQTERYIDQLLQPGASDLVQVDQRFLNEHIKKSEYAEVRQQSVGPMYQIHALLEFDEAARTYFDERWRRAMVTQRLWYTARGAWWCWPC